MMAKMTFTMTRLQWGMEAREKNEERREGKRQEYKERRDEERKREVMRKRKKRLILKYTLQSSNLIKPMPLIPKPHF